MIPNKIHQILLTSPYAGFYKNLWSERIDVLKFLNPNFEYKLWKDKDCLKEFKQEFLYIKRNYQSIVKQADICKLLILKKFGGVVLDIDINLHKPLSKYLKDKQQFDEIFITDNKKLYLFVAFANTNTYNINKLLNYYLSSTEKNTDLILNLLNKIEKKETTYLEINLNLFAINNSFKNKDTIISHFEKGFSIV